MSTFLQYLYPSFSTNLCTLPSLLAGASQLPYALPLPSAPPHVMLAEPTRPGTPHASRAVPLAAADQTQHRQPVPRLDYRKHRGVPCRLSKGAGWYFRGGGGGGYHKGRVGGGMPLK